jgi:hypothetical protein
MGHYYVTVLDGVKFEGYLSVGSWTCKVKV